MFDLTTSWDTTILNSQEMWIVAFVHENKGKTSAERAPSFISAASRLKNIARAAVVEVSESMGAELASVVGVTTYPSLFLLTPWAPANASVAMRLRSAVDLSKVDSRAVNGSVNVTRGMEEMSVVKFNNLTAWAPDAVEK